MVGLGILIFSDASYIACFNSIYSEDLIYICLLYLFVATMSCIGALCEDGEVLGRIGKGRWFKE